MAEHDKAKVGTASKSAKTVKPLAAPAAPPMPVLDVVATPTPEVVAARVSEVIDDAQSTTAVAATKSFSTFDMLLKGMPTMTDTSAFAGTEKAQAILGDFNARAKTAAEKGAKFVEEMTSLTKGNVEAIVASGKIAAKGVEEFGAEAAAYSKTSFEKTTGMFKSLSAVKSPADLMQIQSEYAKSSFDAMVAESSKLTESFVKLATEVMQPLSSRFAIAAEKVKSAAN